MMNSCQSICSATSADCCGESFGVGAGHIDLQPRVQSVRVPLTCVRAQLGVVAGRQATHGIQAPHQQLGVQEGERGQAQRDVARVGCHGGVQVQNLNERERERKRAREKANPHMKSVMTFNTDATEISNTHLYCIAHLMQSLQYLVALVMLWVCLQSQLVHHSVNIVLLLAQPLPAQVGRCLADLVAQRATAYAILCLQNWVLNQVE